jgi:hypothetical protein
MAKASSHHSSSIVKLLFIGDSGTGKTGALESLVRAGYNVRVVDIDNGLDVLVHYIQQNCPDKLDNLSYITCTDKFKTVNGQAIPDGTPKAFGKALKALDHWKDEDEDLGKITEWGPNDVLVIDSFTLLGHAAMRYVKALNPQTRDPRQWYNTAQEYLRSLLEMLYSDAVKCNVIVTSHITYIDVDESMTKGYPAAIGRALSPQIGRYFNACLRAYTRGSGQSQKRLIRTVSDNLVELKNTAPTQVKTELDLGDGLAEYFRIATKRG